MTLLSPSHAHPPRTTVPRKFRTDGLPDEGELKTGDGPIGLGPALTVRW
jgi:hypothetical protein